MFYRLAFFFDGPAHGASALFLERFADSFLEQFSHVTSEDVALPRAAARGSDSAGQRPAARCNLRRILRGIARRRRARTLQIFLHPDIFLDALRKNAERG